MLEGSEDLNKTLDDYRLLLLRRRWWVLLPTCLVALGVVAVSLLLPDSYRSETVILVEPQKVPEHYVVPNVSSELGERLQTMTQQILSRTRLQRIIDEFGLYAEPRSAGLAPEERVERMRENIEIDLVKSSGPRPNDLNAFKISFHARSPRLAQQVTSQLTSLFIEENLKVREQQSLDTTNFLESQLEAARQELQKQEERLSAFKMRFLGELPDQQGSNVQVLTGLQMQLQSTLGAADRARQQRVYLESLLAQYDTMAESGAALPGGAGQPDNSLAGLRRRRAELLARYTPKHPDVVRIEQEIAQAEHLQQESKTEPGGDSGEAPPAVRTEREAGPAIAQIRSQLQANQMELESAEKETARLRQAIGEYERRLHLTPLREQQLADVIRDYNLSRKNYDELLSKKLSSELASNLEKRQQGEQFRILDPPSLPTKPYRPKRLQINLVGLLLGLGTGLGLAYVIELRDRSLYTEKDAARLVPLPLIVGVPALPTPAEQRQQQVRRTLEWVAGLVLVLGALAGELFIYWRG